MTHINFCTHVSDNIIVNEIDFDGALFSLNATLLNTHTKTDHMLFLLAIIIRKIYNKNGIPVIYLRYLRYIIRLAKIAALLICSSALYAQPYFDTVIIRGTMAPHAVIWRKDYKSVTNKHFVPGASLPILFITQTKK